jgi:2-keto-4-pentenoate hydratase/2-oxohepta-3-ene-1,7-dioic acid hydratase in catechol pathway
MEFSLTSRVATLNWFWTVRLGKSSKTTCPFAESALIFGVLLPPEATQPDYEAEFAVLIGKRGHRIAPEHWEEYVFGYTIVKDVSAGSVQLATSQWTLGKSYPTFTPVGPAIVTRDEIPDPNSLDIRLTLSGEVI